MILLMILISVIWFLIFYIFMQIANEEKGYINLGDVALGMFLTTFLLPIAILEAWQRYNVNSKLLDVITRIVDWKIWEIKVMKFKGYKTRQVLYGHKSEIGKDNES